MSRKPTGRPFTTHGDWYARVRIEPIPAPQRNIKLTTCTTPLEAAERAALIADAAGRLVAAGEAAIAPALLLRIAESKGRALAVALAAVEAFASGGDQVGAPKRSAPAHRPTIGETGERWTSGELAGEYPDHVKAKSSAGKDLQRLTDYVYPIARDIPVADFSLDHAEAIMRGIPASHAAATRRHVAQVLHRLLGIAVFPLRLREANPLPKGFLPTIGPPKAKGYLYPDEDAQLLACPDIALCWRVFYGFLNREGCRSGEAMALDLADADLVRGGVKLDENKTNEPRAWAMLPGDVAALRAWVALRERGPRGRRRPLDPAAPLFVDEAGERIVEGTNLARQLRRHMLAAGIDRAELHEHSASRQQMRAHDLRATFVTLALANGRSETWVADRTGHRSSVMINTYRRAARSVAELGLGELRSLVDAIPELAQSATESATDTEMSTEEKTKKIR